MQCCASKTAQESACHQHAGVARIAAGKQADPPTLGQASAEALAALSEAAAAAAAAEARLAAETRRADDAEVREKVVALLVDGVGPSRRRRSRGALRPAAGWLTEGLGRGTMWSVQGSNT